MSTALLLLEIQNDYFPGGRIPLEKSEVATQRAQSVLQVYRDMNLPVIHVQHISTHPNASYFLPCTKGAEFHGSVQPLKNETIVKKHYPNSFKDTNLAAQLKKLGVKHLVICGMTTQLTVDATVRAAYDLGYSCTILQDACAAEQLEFNQMTIPANQVHAAFMGALQSMYARITSSDRLLSQLGARELAVS